MPSGSRRRCQVQSQDFPSTRRRAPLSCSASFHSTERRWKMAYLRKEVRIATCPEDVWAAVRDVGAVHQRLAPGFVVDTKFDGAARTVTFASGTVVHELIVDINDADRRVSWTAVGGRFKHHNGSMQVLAEEDGGSRLVWITDLLPNELALPIGAIQDHGMAVIQQT